MGKNIKKSRVRGLLLARCEPPDETFHINIYIYALADIRYGQFSTSTYLPAEAGNTDAAASSDVRVSSNPANIWSAVQQRSKADRP